MEPWSQPREPSQQHTESDYSPLIVKEINLSQFIKTGENHDKQTITYDISSKRLLQILQHSIKIFNRCGTNLKKDIRIMLPQDWIHLNAVDKEITYMAWLIETKQSVKYILTINLQKEVVIDMLKGDFSFWLAIFFINKTVFCLIFTHKIVYFKIENVTEEVKEICTLKIYQDTHFYVKTYSFNRQYKILLLEKTDNIFHFYNLSKEEHYHTPVLSFKNPFNIIENNFESTYLNSFISLFSKKKTVDGHEQQKNIMNTLSNTNFACKFSQYYLETIYTKLYLVYLSYEKNKIYIIKIKELNNNFVINLFNVVNSNKGDDAETKGVIVIDYLHGKKSTVQFVDNWIFVHDLQRKETMILDIKLKTKNKIVCTCVSPEFPYTKNIVIKGGIIVVNDENKIYKINFDQFVYLKHYPWKHRHLALINVMRRKNGKELVLQTLKTILTDKGITPSNAGSLNNMKINNLVHIFREVSIQIAKVTNIISKIAMKNLSQTATVNNPSFIDIAPELIILSRKNWINQSDIFYNIFKHIIENIEGWVPNYSDSYMIEMIINIVHFANYLQKENITVMKCFEVVLWSYLKAIRSEDRVVEWFKRTNSFPINSEWALYWWSNKFTDKYWKQKGLDIWFGWREYDDIVEYLLEKEGVLNAVMFWKHHPKPIGDYKVIKRLLIKYLVKCEDKAVVKQLHDYVYALNVKI